MRGRALSVLVAATSCSPAVPTPPAAVEVEPAPSASPPPPPAPRMRPRLEMFRQEPGGIVIDAAWLAEIPGAADFFPPVPACSVVQHWWRRDDGPAQMALAARLLVEADVLEAHVRGAAERAGVPPKRHEHGLEIALERLTVSVALDPDRAIRVSAPQPDLDLAALLRGLIGTIAGAPFDTFPTYGRPPAYVGWMLHSERRTEAVGIAYRGATFEPPLAAWFERHPWQEPSPQDHLPRFRPGTEPWTLHRVEKLGLGLGRPFEGASLEARHGAGGPDAIEHACEDGYGYDSLLSGG